MGTTVEVLSPNDRAVIHERSLALLAETGVRVDTGRGRALLADAGALVDESTQIVRFPRGLIEESLRLAPRQFSLGGRRPGWRLPMNEGACSLVLDGEAATAVDALTGDRRPTTYDDWLSVTRLAEDIDEVTVTQQSPMPEGMLDQLSPDAIRDLIGYLMQPAQVPLP